jgi:peptidoglycan/LPS O-acetylase OafA/YrhL
MLFLPANADADAGALLRHLALVQIYSDKGPAVGLDHMWSLCTEVAFCAVLPLLATGLVWMSRGRERAVARAAGPGRAGGRRSPVPVHGQGLAVRLLPDARLAARLRRLVRGRAGAPGAVRLHRPSPIAPVTVLIWGAGVTVASALTSSWNDRCAASGRW